VELAQLVARCNERGVVHRDIKPTNVLVRPDGAMSLIDLDNAGLVGDERGDGRGTPGYASPEQCASGPAQLTDDVYSIGATLLAVAGCTDTMLYHGGPERLDARLVSLLAPELGDDLVGVIGQCLVPAADRFPSAAGLAHAL